MGMTVPKAFGGPGLTNSDAVIVIEEMAKVCGVTGRIIVEANMGAIGAILAYGSEEQKKLAAQRVLSRDKPKNAGIRCLKSSASSRTFSTRSLPKTPVRMRRPISYHSDAMSVFSRCLMVDQL